jgi:hypothetical protein
VESGAQSPEHDDIINLSIDSPAIAKDNDRTMGKLERMNENLKAQILKQKVPRYA